MSKYFDEEGNYIGRANEANNSELCNNDSYPNAKICILFLIIAEAIMLILNCIVFFIHGLDNSRISSGDVLGIFIVTGGLAILVLVLRIIGLGFGKKDFDEFSIAFKLEIAAIIISFVSAIFDKRDSDYGIFEEPDESFLFDKALPFITSILDFFVIFYIIATLKSILITYNKLNCIKFANFITGLFIACIIMEYYLTESALLLQIQDAFNALFSVLMMALLWICRKEV